MKKERKEPKIGDIEVVEFIKNHREGRKPVCLIEGRICFIDRNYRRQFVHEHSIWHVEIMKIKDRVMVVNPVQEIKTAMENDREKKKKSKELAEKFALNNTKHKKLKVKYPYKSQQERKVKSNVVISDTILENTPMYTHCNDCDWDGYDDELKHGKCPYCDSKNVL